MPEEAQLIGFVDDVAIVEVAKHLSDADRISKEAGKGARVWLYSKGLGLILYMMQ